MFQDKRKIMQKNWVMLLPPLGFWTLAQKQTLNGQSTIHPPLPNFQLSSVLPTGNRVHHKKRRVGP